MNDIDDNDSSAKVFIVYIAKDVFDVDYDSAVDLPTAINSVLEMWWSDTETATYLFTDPDQVVLALATRNPGAPDIAQVIYLEGPTIQWFSATYITAPTGKVLTVLQEVTAGGKAIGEARYL